MLRDVATAQLIYDTELDQAKEFASHLNDGIYLITSSRASKGNIGPNDSEDWFLAIGGYVAWGKGKVKVCNKTVTLEFTYKFAKRYQWEMDTAKGVPFGPFTITDKEVGELAAAGYAKEFNVLGTTKETITWKKE